MMGWFKKKFAKKDSTHERPSNDYHDLNKNVGYMYLIIGSQIVLVLLIMGFMMFVGAVISTPWWIFAAIFIAGTSICYYLYRKAKKKWEELKAAIKQINLGDKNYEISIMGGMLTMRIEHNPRYMLEARPVEPPKALPSSADRPLPNNEEVSEEPAPTP
ncbi:MAG: hypothetical protein ACP5TY_03220 [Thermodesulforhabdaceae bacterium]